MKNKIEDGKEVLFRQIHPLFYPDGKLGSRAFKPNSDDNGLMSTDIMSLTTAEAAFHHYTHYLKKESACVFAVSVAEFASEDIACYKDPLEEADVIPANMAHCLADYTPHSKNAWKNIAQRLKIKAEARGCQYTPPSVDGAASSQQSPGS